MVEASNLLLITESIGMALGFGVLLAIFGAVFAIVFSVLGGSSGRICAHDGVSRWLWWRLSLRMGLCGEHKVKKQWNV